uniref:Uncharacterized protein n=1 Tax=Panagrolaimus davidi TaxID=227884 RepID=A0A914QYJ3_9BILA
MFLTKFWTKYDPIYRKELEKLFRQIEEIKESDKEKSDKTTLNLLNEFSSNFLMPKKLWDKKIKLIRSLTLGDYYVYKMGVAAECVFHLCYLTIPDRKYLHIPYLHDKKLYYCEDRDLQRFYEPELIIENICFPHKNLEMKWKDLEFCATSLIPRSDYRRFEKMKKLFIKIKSIRNNTEKWFNALMEAEDYEFVVDNVEYRLNLNLKLLETYSKYCRFFLEDSEMLEEYRKASEKYGPSIVSWKNTFIFEIYDKNCLDFVTPTIITPSPAAAKCLTYFDTKNVSPQNFPFRSNLMHYILKTANASILNDLLKSCKWFYLNYPISICYKLGPSYRKINHLNGIQIKGKSISIRDCFSLPKTLENIFITSSLTLWAKRFPNILPLIYRCTAKYISLSDQILSAEELNILIGHGNVLDLDFEQVKDSSDNYLILENLLKMVPKIKNFMICGVQCTSETSQMICELPFENKIGTFRLIGIKNTVLEPKCFAEFIKKNISTKGDVELKFDYSDDREEYELNLNEIVNTVIDENWKNEKQKPKFFIY